MAMPNPTIYELVYAVLTEITEVRGYAEQPDADDWTRRHCAEKIAELERELARLRGEDGTTVDRYTAAPDAYDGFGTATVASTGLVNQGRHDPIRSVRINRRDLDWQVARYRSGRYPLWTAGEVDELRNAGLIVEQEALP